MTFIKLLIISTIASVIPGQLIRLPVGHFGAVTLSDIFVLLTSLAFILYFIFGKKPFNLPRYTFFTLLFILSATASTILALGVFTPTEVAISSFFLVRFVLYFFFSVVTFNIIQKDKISSWLNIVLAIGVVFTIIGFVQLWLFPNFSFLTVYGWDPHQKRIASTLLDPNFTGGLLLFFFSLSISIFLFNNKKIYVIASSLFFIAIMLTFSRSAYLAFFLAVMTVAIFKSPKILVVALVAFFIIFLSIGQTRQRIVGAFTLDETSKARVASWQKAVEIFLKYPLFGTGFNTYRFAQIKYGNFTFDHPSGGHSGSSSDSSILTVAATTGSLGLCFYLLMLAATTKAFLKKAKASPANLGAAASFIGLLAHSQFVNSLFFPQIMLIYWFLFGLCSREKDNKTTS